MKKLNKLALMVVLLIAFIFVVSFIIILASRGLGNLNNSDEEIDFDSLLEELDSEHGVYDFSERTEPNLTNPITPEQIAVHANEDSQKGIFVYTNRNNFTAINARPGILECNDSNGKYFEDFPIWTYSARANVPSMEKVGFETSIYTDEDIVPGTYYCTILVMEGYHHGTADVRDNMQWLGGIRSPENPVYEVGSIEIKVE